MNDTRSQLADWRNRGLITPDQEEALASDIGVGVSTDHRMLEALTYVGAVLFLIGGLLIAFDVGFPSDFSSDGNDWGTFLIALAVAVALGGAGWLIADRWMAPIADRALGLVMLAAWSSFFVAVGVLVGSIIDLGDASVLIIGLALLAVAYPLFRWRPGAPTQFALAVSSVVAIAGFLLLAFSSDDIADNVFIGFDPDTGVLAIAGILFTTFGLGWMHLADKGSLRSRNLGYVLGGIVALSGLQFFANIAQGWSILIVGVGVYLVLAGMRRARSLLMAIGTFYIVIGLVSVLELLFEDSPRPAGILMVIAGIAALAAVAMRADTIGSGSPSIEEGPPPVTNG